MAGAADCHEDVERTVRLSAAARVAGDLGALRGEVDRGLRTAAVPGLAGEQRVGPRRAADRRRTRGRGQDRPPGSWWSCCSARSVM